MKYIRTQSGSVISVSQLLVPSKAHSEGREIWRLTAITADSQRCAYAAYENKDAATEAYEFVVAFMRSTYSLLEFISSAVVASDGDYKGILPWPLVYEDRNEGLDDADSRVPPDISPEEEDTK